MSKIIDKIALLPYDRTMSDSNLKGTHIGSAAHVVYNNPGDKGQADRQ